VQVIQKEPARQPLQLNRQTEERIINQLVIHAIHKKTLPAKGREAQKGGKLGLGVKEKRF
jgi:hypothetical protein